ncbi:MAG: putative S-adenosylmethionine-dependent methyltransferase [Bacteroidota bacterium]|jgi:predicted RNA methylase|nr:putative S-adenosylmethionine-dependent methyltransferase [Bacteroidota bacterium]
MENAQKLIHTHDLTEKSFESFLPANLRTASRLHFTPIEVAKKASEWLTETPAKSVLDIGAGVGKFCITGAYHSNAHFYGVEHRESLCNIGNQIAGHFGLQNVNIRHANILDIRFSDYDAFYLYNPFYENLEFVKRLNDEVTLEEDLYQVYLNHTETQLDQMKKGTRLVTYHGNNFEVPNSYEKVAEAFNGELKLWIKQS